jgi:mannose-6-phosphate isomerase-like protein (cupin superfamily)
LVERKLKMGDVVQIPAGFTFYIVNIGAGQRLQIICGIDVSESLGSANPYEVAKNIVISLFFASMKRLLLKLN